MKNRWQGIRIAVLTCVVTGWWGLWYPELATAADAYAIVMEDGTVQSASEVIECELDGDSYWDLLKIDSSQIRVRSKLWEKLKEYYKEDWSE